jgi:hypothetical protein
MSDTERTSVCALMCEARPCRRLCEAVS